MNDAIYYRLTQWQCAGSNLAHEHVDHFRNRRGLYSRGASMAGHGATTRQRVVGPSASYQLNTTRDHDSRWTNLESLARARVDLSSEKPLQRLVLGVDHLSLLHVYLLLVASVSP